jgi:hypothetical protein
MNGLFDYQAFGEAGPITGVARSHRRCCRRYPRVAELCPGSELSSRR